jgi:hypothetical protein
MVLFIEKHVKNRKKEKKTWATMASFYLFIYLFLKKREIKETP